MAGYLYGCCPKGQYNMVKIGVTCNQDPFIYVKTNYARTMVPLQIIFVLPMSNAPLMEKLTHHLLHTARLDDKHEVFDLMTSDGQLDSNRLEVVKELVMRCDSMAEKALPTAPEVIEEQHQAKEEARKGRQALAEARDKKRADKRARRKAKEAQKQDQKQCSTNAHEDKRAANEAQRRDSVNCLMSRLDTELKKFIEECCSTSPTSFVPTMVFKKAFEDYSKLAATSMWLKPQMVALGFVWKDKKIRGKSVKSFCGIRML